MFYSNIHMTIMLNNTHVCHHNNKNYALVLCPHSLEKVEPYPTAKTTVSRVLDLINVA